MAATPIRVFLFAGSRELHRYLRHLGETLQNAQGTPLDPLLCVGDPTQLPPNMRPRFPREMQEGDLLLTFSMSQRCDAVRRLEEEANRRKLIVLPFLVSRDPIPRDLTAHPFPEERFDTVLIEARQGEAALTRIVLRTLTERMRMCDPATDLLLRPPAPDAALEPPSVNALDALLAEGRDSPSQLVQLANEGRRQAATAIHARLFELAQEALRGAMSNDATSAVTAYWLARLGVGRNIGASLEDGLREATRAARLAHLDHPGSPLEAASWRLAARICAMRRDHTGFREYLENATASEPKSDSLLFETLRLYHRAGLSRDGLPLLEALYIRDRAGAESLACDPDLPNYKAHLQILHERQEAYLHTLLKDLAINEEAICALRGTTPPPAPPTTITDPHADALDLLEGAGRARAAFQLEVFNEWAIDLIETTRALHRLTQEHRALANASREMPRRSDFEGLVERLWPRLRERYEALRKALAETDFKQEKLAAAKAQAFNQLKEESKRFLLHTGMFERILTRHPGFLKPRTDSSDRALRHLAVLDASDPLPRLDTALPEDICELLDFDHLEIPEPGLYRIELAPRDANDAPDAPRRPRAASRVGVYFQEAKRKFSEME